MVGARQDFYSKFTLQNFPFFGHANKTTLCVHLYNSNDFKEEKVIGELFLFIIKDRLPDFKE